MESICVTIFALPNLASRIAVHWQYDLIEVNGRHGIYNCDRSDAHP